MNRIDVSKYSRIKIVLFSVLPLILLLLTGELFCRVKLYFAHQRNPFFLASPLFGDPEGRTRTVVYKCATDHFFQNDRFRWYYKIKPGSYLPPQPYDYGTYTINSLGFRNAEFNPSDKFGKTRIFCLGESSTMSLESPDKETWPARLQHYLNLKAPGKFEVINAGFEGYVSSNYLNLIRRELVQYKPDIFIFYAGFNDATLKKGFGNSWIDKIIGPIHRALYFRWSMLYTMIIEKTAMIASKSPNPMNLFNKDSAKDRFLQNIESIIAICKENGIRPIFVRQMINTNNKALFFSDDFTFEEIEKLQKKSQDYSYYREYAGFATIFEYNNFMKALKEICSKYGIPFIDVRKEYYENVANKKKLFIDFVHLTPQGNDILARLIMQNTADLIKKRLPN